MTERQPSISVGQVGTVGDPKPDKGLRASDLAMPGSDQSDGATFALPTYPTGAVFCRTQKAIYSQGDSDHSDRSDQTRAALLRDALRAAFAPDEIADTHSGGMTEKWRDYFEERAAIREYDGGLSRADAEAAALADCVVRWRAFNPLPPSIGGARVQCGKSRADTPVPAFRDYAWLHQKR